MDYPEALRYVLSFTNLAFMRHIPYAERTWNLDRIQHLMAALDYPHTRFPVVHIAGSKGKGSTAAAVEAVLRAAGLRPGLYTSPHLHTFRERVRVDGRLISRDDWARLVTWMRPRIEALPERPNTFDVLTALAYQYFAEQRVPIAVVEVGLGGRLDSTNVVRPIIGVITTLDLEHTAILGPTLRHIAREKGGIIKPGVPVVVAPQPPEAMEVLETIAEARGARLIVLGREWHYRVEDVFPEGIWVDVEGPTAAYRRVFVALRGKHQGLNAALAIVTLHTLAEAGWPIDESHIRAGLATVHWPARTELLQERPALLLDAAHTLQSMRLLVDSLNRWFVGRRVHVLFGVSEDKPITELLEILWPHVETLFVTRSEHPRAASPDHILYHLPDRVGPEVRVHARVEEALQEALAWADPEDVICVCGSIFLAAAVRELWAHRYGRLPVSDWAYQSDFPILRRLLAAPSSGALRNSDREK